jgi:hypothetical protein
VSAQGAETLRVIWLASRRSTKRVFGFPVLVFGVAALLILSGLIRLV